MENQIIKLKTNANKREQVVRNKSEIKCLIEYQNLKTYFQPERDEATTDEENDDEDDDYELPAPTPTQLPAIQPLAVEKMKMLYLQIELKKFGAPTKGRKPELVERLKYFLTQNSAHTSGQCFVDQDHPDLQAILRMDSSQLTTAQFIAREKFSQVESSMLSMEAYIHHNGDISDCRYVWYCSLLDDAHKTLELEFYLNR